ncbi:hypothetical protein BDV96DRAFT_600858 [Lophiotrema nucula]|uniref:Uncharacterized protein n=1 Tax=Lophiotrema nucula TaxID=690887 RepID=A0A6A5Z6Y8_9PLEO|nr:hypothetical protein BDV96DRAFT_600858 [Lophiotrema nucula]
MNGIPGGSTSRHKWVYSESPPLAQTTPPSGLAFNKPAGKRRLHPRNCTANSSSIPTANSNTFERLRQLLHEVELHQMEKEKQHEIQIAMLKAELAQCHKREDAVRTVLLRVVTMGMSLSKTKVEQGLQDAEPSNEEDGSKTEKDGKKKRKRNKKARRNQQEEPQESNGDSVQSPKVSLDDGLIERRRREYYRGWFHCAKAVESRGSYNHPYVDTRELEDEPGGLCDPNKPEDMGGAGIAVGSIFGWSALCKTHGLPEDDPPYHDQV